MIRRDSWRLSRLDRARDFHALVTFDLVAGPHVVVILDADAALGAGAHFIDIVLETTQGFELALEDHDALAQHANRVVAPDVSVHHQAARDIAEFGRAEHFAYFGQPHDLLAQFGREHAGQ